MRKKAKINKKITIKKIMLVIITTIIFLVVAEILFRVIYVDEQESLKQTANKQFYKTNNLILAYNSLDDIPGINMKKYGETDNIYFKANNTIRVLVLGDSVAKGYLLNKTFSEFLSEKLNRDTKLNNDISAYEVINLGITGYTTIQESELLKEEGVKYKPDIILLTYVMNDPLIFSGTKYLLTKKEMDKRSEIINDLIDAPLKCKIRTFFQKSYFIYKTRTVDFLFSPITRFEKLHTLDILKLENNPDFYKYIHNDICAWKQVQYSFYEISKISKKEEVPVILVIFPVNFIGENWIYKYPLADLHKKVIEEGLKNRFMILDLLETYKKYNPEELRSKNIDTIHPNELGHELAANENYKKLKSEKLI